MTQQPIVILCAMITEAQVILDALNLAQSPTPWPNSYPPRCWSGQINNHPIHLIANGRDPATNAELIGTTPATLATTLTIQHLNPKAILIAGAAGGCSKSTNIGDVLLIDKAFHHDRRIPLPEFNPYAHGPESLHASPQLASAFKAQLANISTGNALDTLEHELEFFTTNQVTVKDMETASIAWAASLTQTPTLALRAITDHYDHPTPEHQFLANFQHALTNLAKSVTAGLPALIEEFTDR